MFNNNNMNTGRETVNTHIDTFFGDLSYLGLACWDDKVSFKWSPAVGKNERGRVQYDKDRTVKSGLVHPKIETLLARYKKKLKKSIEEGEDPGEDGICVGVPVLSGRGEETTTTGLFIEYKRGENGGYDTYFTLAKSLTNNGTDAIARYKFNKNTAIEGTTPEKGAFTSVEEHGEFFWFIKLLSCHGNIARYSDHNRAYNAAFSNRGTGSATGNSFDNGGGMGDFMNVPQTTDGFSVFPT